MSTFARFFERCTRTDDQSVYYTLSDDRPEWLYDAVHEAHDGELPNDWRYDTAHSIVLLVDEGVEDASEIADSLVDVRIADLLSWLSDNVSRTEYCDEWRDEGGDMDSLDELVLMGQFTAIERMASILLEAVQDAESIVDSGSDAEGIPSSIAENGDGS